MKKEDIDMVLGPMTKTGAQRHASYYRSKERKAQIKQYKAGQVNVYQVLVSKPKRKDIVARNMTHMKSRNITRRVITRRWR